MNKAMTESLVMQTLFRTVASKYLDKGFIVHSDRGVRIITKVYYNSLA